VCVLSCLLQVKYLRRFAMCILYIKVTMVSVCLFVLAVLGKFFQSLLVPCGVLCRGGGLGLSVCVSVTIITQLSVCDSYYPTDGPGTGEVQ